MRLTRRSLIMGLATLPTIDVTAFAATGVTPKIDPPADRAAAASLRRLISGYPAARLLNGKAVAVLVFPRIVKVGFLLGGAYGEGALRQHGNMVGYYNSAAASFGPQAGVQWFGYALFFMTEAALKYLDVPQGFEIGVGPAVVVVDEGRARKFGSADATQDVYGFIFGPNGLMAGPRIEGTKITRI